MTRVTEPELQIETTAVIEALIFDCDGTLTDSMFAHFSAWRDALKPQGMLLDKQKFYRHSGTPSSRVIPMLAAEQDVQVDFHRALAEKEEIFADKIGLLKPVEPVVQIAREHRGKIPMAVASGGTRRLVDMQLQQINITDWFETVVTCEDTVKHKPDPDVFLEAARRLGVEASRCRVYEDGEPGIEAAARAGMECIDIRTMLES
jgi:HAD superfamily hydrolase (TIGR01509 family)